MVLPVSTRTRSRLHASRRPTGSGPSRGNSSARRARRPLLRWPNNCRRNATYLVQGVVHQWPRGAEVLLFAHLANWAHPGSLLLQGTSCVGPPERFGEHRVEIL